MNVRVATVALCLAIAPATFAAGPGGGNPEQDWDWCMQESVKAAVWSGIVPEAAVNRAFRGCRVEFSAWLATARNKAEERAIRKEVKRGYPDLVAFAKRMKKVR